MVVSRRFLPMPPCRTDPGDASGKLVLVNFILMNTENGSLKGLCLACSACGSDIGVQEALQLTLYAFSIRNSSNRNRH
jgi:hypothetical protein